MPVEELDEAFPLTAAASSGYGTAGQPAGELLANERPGLGLSRSEAAVAVLKGVVGPAVLYLPHGFAEGGWGFAVPMLWASWGMFAWGGLRLLEVWSIQPLSYPLLMEKALGKNAGQMVRLFITLQQLALCTSYLVFISRNMGRLLGLDPSFVCLLQLVLLVPLGWVREIRQLRHTNLLAAGLIGQCLLLFAVAAGLSLVRRFDPPAVFNQSAFYQFIGTSAFAWEGMAALSIPLQGAVKPAIQHEFPRLFLCTTAGIALGYSLFGLLNVMAYGRDAQMILADNLQPGPGRGMVELCFSLAVALTFPLQLCPAIGMLKELAEQQLPPNSLKMHETSPIICGQSWIQLLGLSLRSAMVVTLAAAAILFNDSLPQLVAVVGSCLGVPLSFIFPSLIHLMLVKSSLRMMLANLMVSICGCVLCVVTTAVTIIKWNEADIK